MAPGNTAFSTEHDSPRNISNLPVTVKIPAGRACHQAWQVRVIAAQFPRAPARAVAGPTPNETPEPIPTPRVIQSLNCARQAHVFATQTKDVLASH
jgi:hypothetical protein